MKRQLNCRKLQELFMKKQLILILCAFSLLTFVTIGTAKAYQSSSNKSFSLTMEPDDPGNRFGTTNRGYRYSENEASFFLSVSDENNDRQPDTISIIVEPYAPIPGNPSLFRLTFSTARIPARITVGAYSGTMSPSRATFGTPGMSIHSGCTSPTGEFVILDAQFSGNSLLSFAASFRQTCPGWAGGRYGSIFYNSLGAPLPLEIRPDSLPDALSGSAYSQHLEGSGGIIPYVWAMPSGQLPPGLSFNSTGTISGTPAVTGSYNFTLTVSDSGEAFAVPKQTASRSFTLIVKDSAPFFTSSSPPQAIKNGAYHYSFQAEGGSPPYVWSLNEGNLPPGLTLTDAGRLNGVPTNAGTYNFAIQVTDAVSRIAKQSYSLKVIELPVIISAQYKAKKSRLTVDGEKFSATAKLYVDGILIVPKSQDSFSFIVKNLVLTTGNHDVQVVNPDSGTASIVLSVK
jgi:hypothetical protein